MKTSALQVSVRSLALSALGLFSFAVRADNVVEIISPDGTTTNAYESFDAGFKAATANGTTIRLLADIEWDVSWKGVAYSLNWDLNGHLLKNKSNDFLCIGTGQTHWFYGGGTLQGAVSVLAGDGGGSTVYLTNITVKGICTVCNKARTEVLADTRIRTTQVSSKNITDADAIRIHPGAYVNVAQFRDNNDTDPTKGVQIQALGGCWNLAPTKYVAAGRYLMWAPVKVDEVQYIYEVTDDAARYANCEAIGDGDEGYPTLANAVSATTDGRIRLTRDLPNTIVKPTFPKYYNVTLDLNGHALELGGNCCWVEVGGGLHLTNGTVKVSGSGVQGGFWIRGDGANFTADATVSFVHGTGSGLDSIAFLFDLWSNLSRVTLDGSTVSTSALYSFNPNGGKYGEWYSGVTVKGDANVSCRKYSYRGDDPSTAPYLLQATKIMGGIYTADPLSYLASGCIEGQSSSSLRWKVWNLSEDVKIDLASGETLTFKGAAPAQPMQVQLDFSLANVPRRTLIGDLSGLTGNLSNLTFAVPAGAPGNVKAEVIGGKLYVRRIEGFVVVVE